MGDMTDPATLAAWIRQQLDIDQCVAREATGGPWRNAPTARHHTTVSGRTEEGVFGAGGMIVASTGEARERQNLVNAEHIARHDPTRVLRAVEAKRRVLAAYDNALTARKHAAGDIGHLMEGAANTLEHVLRMLATEYADRPGYREEWRP